MGECEAEDKVRARARLNTLKIPLRYNGNCHHIEVKKRATFEDVIQLMNEKKARARVRQVRACACARARARARHP